jgi:hypothetical protein
MTYEVSIDSAIGIDGDDGDDSRYGMDVFVEGGHSSTSSNVSVAPENPGNNNDNSNGNPNGIARLEYNSYDGDDGDDGINNNMDNNNIQVTNLDSRAKSDTSPLSSHNDDIHLENTETDQTLTSINNQVRKAIANASTHTPTNNLSHHPHLSQPTKEMIAEFFYDDPDLPYHPPPPHTLDESPCKSIIRIDNHSLYYCTLHSDVRSYYLDSIEHDIKYKEAQLHRLQILKFFNVYQHERRLL